MFVISFPFFVLLTITKNSLLRLRTIHGIICIKKKLVKRTIFFIIEPLLENNQLILSRANNYGKPRTKQSQKLAYNKLQKIERWGAQNIFIIKLLKFSFYKPLGQNVIAKLQLNKMWNNLRNCISKWTKRTSLCMHIMFDYINKIINNQWECICKKVKQQIEWQWSIIGTTVWTSSSFNHNKVYNNLNYNLQ